MPQPEIAKTVRRARRRPLFEAANLASTDHQRAAIERILPHRGAMLLLDAITGVDTAGGRLVGRRRLDPEDPVFAGHFPGDPVYPGCLQVEMMGQLGLCLGHFTNSHRAETPLDTTPSPVRLIRVHDGVFVSEAHPGSDITVLAEEVENDGFTLTCVGQLLDGERIISACAFDAMILEDGDE